MRPLESIASDLYPLAPTFLPTPRLTTGTEARLAPRRRRSTVIATIETGFYLFFLLGIFCLLIGLFTLVHF